MGPKSPKKLILNKEEENLPLNTISKSRKPVCLVKRDLGFGMPQSNVTNNLENGFSEDVEEIETEMQCLVQKSFMICSCIDCNETKLNIKASSSNDELSYSKIELKSLSIKASYSNADLSSVKTCIPVSGESYLNRDIYLSKNTKLKHPRKHKKKFNSSKTFNSHLSGSGSKNNERGRKAQKSSVCKNCQEVFLNKVLYGLHTVIDCARNRQKKKQNSKVKELREEGHVEEVKRDDRKKKTVDIEKKEIRVSSEGFPSRRKPPREVLNKSKSKPNMRFNTRSQSKKNKNKSSNDGASDLIVEMSQSAISIQDEMAIMEDVHEKFTMKDEESKESKLEVMADDKKKQSRLSLPGKKNRKRRKKKSEKSDFDENFNLEEKNSDLDSPILKKKKVVVSNNVDEKNSSLESSNVKSKMKSKLSATISSIQEKQVPKGSCSFSIPKSVQGVEDDPCENRVDQEECNPSSKARLIDSPQSGQYNVQSESPKISGTNTMANDTVEINEIEGDSLQSGILIEEVGTCRQSDSSVIITLGELLNDDNRDTNMNVESGNIGMEVSDNIGLGVGGNIGLGVLPSACTGSSSLSISLVAPNIEKSKQNIGHGENEPEKIKAGRESVIASPKGVEAIENVEVEFVASKREKDNVNSSPKERLNENDKQKRKRWKREKRKEWERKRIIKKRALDSSSSESDVSDNHKEKLIKKNKSRTKEPNRKKSPRKGFDRTGAISKKTSGVTLANDKSKEKCREVVKPSKNRKSLLKSSRTTLSVDVPGEKNPCGDASAAASASVHGQSTNLPYWSKSVVNETMSLAEQLQLTDDSDIVENSENLKQVVGGKETFENLGSNLYSSVNNALDNFVQSNANKVCVDNFVKSCENGKNPILGSLKTAVVGSLAKEVNDESIMDHDINNWYNDPKFSEDYGLEGGELSDASGAEMSQFGNRLSPSLRRKTPIPAIISCSPTLDNKNTVGPSQQLSNEVVNENKNMGVNKARPEQIVEETQMFPIVVKKELVVTGLTLAKVSVIDDDEDTILLDVSYTMLDDEEEDDFEKHVNEDTKDLIYPAAEKINCDLEHENKREVVIKPERVRGKAGTELNNKMAEHRRRPRENKCGEEKKQSEVGQFKRGNYCSSVLTPVECLVVGCPWIHVLEPKDAQEEFYSIYHQCGEEQRTKRLVSFWRSQAVKSVPTGCQVLSSLSEMASIGKLKMETRDLVELVDFVNKFPNLYTMSREEGRFVMENLLKAFMLGLKEQAAPASRMDMDTFFDFVWNRIYLSSLRHGIVIKQEILERICSLAEMLRRYCQLSDLIFLSSLSPTMWVPINHVALLLTLVSELPGNSLDCSCMGQEHTRVACSYLAKTLSRLSNFEWAVLSREVSNVDGKLQALVNVVEGDSVENIGRFIERVQAMGLRVFLPKVDNRSETTKERLERGLALGKWKGVARDIMMVEKICVEDMVEIMEELYGLMSQLAHHAAGEGIETLLKELVLLGCSNIHRELYCQLGLSLLVKLLTLEAENKMAVGARVVHCMVRTGVDLMTVKPLIVFELGYLLDANCTPITFPLVLLDVYIQSGYIALALNLAVQWDYLQTYPRRLGPGDQQRKHLIFETLLDKALVSCGGNALPMCLRIFEILCSGNVGEWPLLKKTKMTEDGRIILVEMLNRNLTGGDLWRVVKGLDRSLQAVTGEVARGVLVRLVQAGMLKEATELYKWDELTASGTYYKQETRVPILKVNLKSYFSLEELEIVITEFFNELKKTPRIAHDKDVFIDMKEVEIPPSTIVLHRRITGDKQEAVIRVCQVLAAFNPPMSVSIGVGGVPFISKEQVYNYIIQ